MAAGLVEDVRGDILIDREQIAGLILAEEEGMERQVLGRGRDICAHAAGHRHLRQGQRNAAVRDNHGPSSTWPERMSWRTKSPLRFSWTRSTGGGAPSSRPQMSRR